MTKLYQVRDPKNPDEVIMIAPLNTIRHVFNMHREGIARVLRDLERPHAIACYYFNGQSTAVATSGSITIARCDEQQVKKEIENAQFSYRPIGAP